MRHSLALCSFTLMALGVLAGCQESGTDPSLTVTDTNTSAQAENSAPQG